MFLKDAGMCALTHIYIKEKIAIKMASSIIYESQESQLVMCQLSSHLWIIGIQHLQTWPSIQTSHQLSGFCLIFHRYSYLYHHLNMAPSSQDCWVPRLPEPWDLNWCRILGPIPRIQTGQTGHAQLSSGLQSCLVFRLPEFLWQDFILLTELITKWRPSLLLTSWALFTVPGIIFNVGQINERL